MMKQYPLCGTINRVLIGNICGGSLKLVAGEVEDLNGYDEFSQALPYPLFKLKSGTLGEILDDTGEIYIANGDGVVTSGVTNGWQLFDITKAEDNKYQQYDVSGGNTSIVAGSNYWSTGYIDLKEKSKRNGETTVFLSLGCTSGMFYDSEKNVITSTTLHDISVSANFSEKTVTIPDNARYLYLSFSKTDYAWYYPNKFNIMMVCLGGYHFYEEYTGGMSAPNILYPAVFSTEDGVEIGATFNVLSANLCNMPSFTANLASGGTYSLSVNLRMRDYKICAHIISDYYDIGSKIYFRLIYTDDTVGEKESQYINTSESRDSDLEGCYFTADKDIKAIEFYDAEVEETTHTINAYDISIEMQGSYDNFPLEEREYREPQSVILLNESPLYSIECDSGKELTESIKQDCGLYQETQNMPYVLSDCLVCYLNENLSCVMEETHTILKIVLADCNFTSVVKTYVDENNNNVDVREFTCTIQNHKARTDIYTDGSFLVESNIARYSESNFTTSTYKLTTGSNSITLLFRIDPDLLPNNDTEAVTQFKQLCQKVNAYVMVAINPPSSVVTGGEMALQNLIDIQIDNSVNNLFDIDTGTKAYAYMRLYGHGVNKNKQGGTT